MTDHAYWGRMWEPAGAALLQTTLSPPPDSRRYFLFSQRAPGRGGAGSRPNKSSAALLELDTMQAPRGREIALPAAGSRTMSGRGGAGNAKSHYVDNDVFRRVLEFETSVVQSKPKALPRVGRSEWLSVLGFMRFR